MKEFNNLEKRLYFDLKMNKIEYINYIFYFDYFTNGLSKLDNLVNIITFFNNMQNIINGTNYDYILETISNGTLQRIKIDRDSFLKFLRNIGTYPDFLEAIVARISIGDRNGKGVVITYRYAEYHTKTGDEPPKYLLEYFNSL